MNIGARAGFFTVEELGWKFRSIDFPIELAMPWLPKYWPETARRLDEIVAYFHGRELPILSMHATQGKIADDRFLVWGKETLDLAGALGVRDITAHPCVVRDWANRLLHQAEAVANLRALGGLDLFSIETFGGKSRLFRPAELVELGIPMTLDTAHVREEKEVYDLIDKYHASIRTVHLSAAGERGHHLPIDHFCLTVVGRLKMIGWSGNLILEYLPWHHYRVRDDIEALTEFVERGRCPRLLPASDRFRERPSRHGFNRDGSFG